MPSGKQSSKPPADLVAYTDGGARGNPGPAAYGVVIRSADGKPIAKLRKYLGETTNNEAEYQGLLAALEYALAHDARSLRVFSDSELLVRQIRKQYKVKSGGLRPLYERAQELIGRLPRNSFTIAHVRREQNRKADRLVNEAIDGHFSPQRHRDTEKYLSDL
ncbi:MAG: ribonuclease HI family protein [Acidobacteria bacterium]|nr:ribonuclease HI family protein [Acidobacteriota bacterium]